MRYAALILLVLACAGCEGDQPKIDYLVGTWVYSQLGVKFKITADGEVYGISDVTVNNVIWHKKEIAGITKGKKIESITLIQNSNSTEGVAFFGCVPKGENIGVDSVWHVTGSPQVKTVFYNQIIAKE